MGAGKSTVGRALARRRGWAFVDSDAQVEARTGRTVAEIWRSESEAVFRRTEAEVLAEALAGDEPAVVAAAGGVVLDPASRRRLRRGGRVVWLRARPETLGSRVAGADHRPLLDADPATTLARLVAERHDLYAEVADAVVDVDGLSAAEVVEAVERTLAKVGAGDDESLQTVVVDLGPRAYPVLVGAGARHRLLDVLPVGVRRAAIVTQETVGVSVEAGVDQRTFLMGDGEEAKCLETVEDLCRGFSRFGLTRGDVVVAVGGGVVTDTAGLAAAVYHRGVAVVHVATSLLAQVDAAIGGKTGVNLPEGKNLVGAFWQPAAVLCDTEVLATLPPAEYRSGLGELAKYHFIDETAGFADLPLTVKIARCVEIKARFVEADEREEVGSGPLRRAILNYGHTLAHALETAGHYDLRHGEAVAIGLVFAARLARRLGRIDDERVEDHLRVVTGYGLPTAVPPGSPTAELVELMGRDKKARGGLTFVLDGPRGLEVVEGIARVDVEETLEETSG